MASVVDRGCSVVGKPKETGQRLLTTHISYISALCHNIHTKIMCGYGLRIGP